MSTASLINTFLTTGREALALEQRLSLMALGDPLRARLGRKHQEVLRRQQAEIVAAVRAGVEWSTVEFALRLHGQHADREAGSAVSTPAEAFLELLERSLAGVAPTAAAGMVPGSASVVSFQ
ncbi:hypothetical protein SAMN05421812_1365 [Asanoa hainanensis]|uniref:Uncharacterized protein n=1 Tax=Asanoa hainanensis TaxID=560556 RepID=A0A239PI20_9ACTN|nr:hypothetical protein SAMN05421812_1365 [Asanoa hainanensis]